MDKYTILGLARSGIAAAYKLKELGYKPFLSEYNSADKIAQSEDLISEFTCEFGGHTKKALDCDIMVVSPGISDIPILKLAQERGIELISEIELGFRLKSDDSRIIAITGSNGKSTTVSLIHHILKTVGFNSILAGNIGTAFTSYPIEKPGIDFIVLELSSFQLERIRDFKPDVAAILNITPDHLNRYDSFAEYAKTKFKIFNNLTAKQIAIYNADDSTTAEYLDLIKGKHTNFSLNNSADINVTNNFINYKNYKIPINAISIKGPHNVANAMASILAVSHFNISEKVILEGLKTFISLPHRLEFVRTINEIDFINDSKATNTDSVKYAVLSFNQPIRLIMGGRGKGEDYTILNPYLQKHVAKIYLIGETQNEMRQAFEGICPLVDCASFEEAIMLAYQEANAGETVLLSTACTSYDMFPNFEVRGDTYKKIVGAIKI